MKSYWSYYRKSVWNNCPYRAQVLFIDKFKPSFNPDLFERSAFQGIVTHECLEYWFKNRWFERDDFTKTTDYSAHLKDFSYFCKTILLDIALDKFVKFKYNTFEQHLKVVISWVSIALFLIKEKIIPVLYSYSVEEDIKSDFYNLSIGSKIDLVIFSFDSSIWVVDWKGTKFDYISPKMDEQLYFYAMAIYSKYNKIPSGLGFAFFQTQELNFKHIALSELKKFKSYLNKCYDSFIKGPNIKKPSQLCMFCEFNMSCDECPSYAKSFRLKEKFSGLEEGLVNYTV